MHILQTLMRSLKETTGEQKQLAIEENRDISVNKTVETKLKMDTVFSRYKSDRKNELCER